MAGLTWRDVAAPDFRTSLEGYKTFSNMLGDAFSGLDRGLGKFDAGLSERANSEIMAAAIQQRDPAAFKKALEAGTILNGVDTRRINPETFQFLNNQAGTLLNQATAETNLENLNYNTGRTKDANSRTDAARDASNQYMVALANGDEGKAAQILAANPALLNQNADQVSALLSGGQNLTKGTVDIAGGRLNNTGKAQSNRREDWQFGVDKETYAERKAGDAAAVEMLELSSDPESARAAFTSGRYAGLSPSAKLAALERLNGTFGNIFAPEDLGISSGSGGAGGATPTGSADDITRGFNYVANGKGYSALPSTVTTQGAARDYQQSMNNRGVRETAVGLYQIVGRTREHYAKKAFGDGWRNQPLNAQTDDLIAKEIFLDPKHRSVSAIRKQWVGLNKYSDAQVANILKMPWEQAREYISKVESPGGVSAGQVLADGNVASALIADRVNKNNINSAGPAWERSMTDTSSLSQVSGELVKGEFSGVKRSWVESQIQNIYKRGIVNGKPTINYATAGEILKKNLRNQEKAPGAFEDIFNIRKAGQGSGRPDVKAIDNEGISADIAELRGTGGVGRAIGQNSLAAKAGSVQAAQSQLAQAQNQLARTLQRAQTQPGLAAQIPRLQARVEAAQAQLQGLLIDVSNDPTVSTPPPRRSMGALDFVSEALRRASK